MTAVVGFDRKLKLEWLDDLADQVAKGEDVSTLRTFLHERLEEDHPGETARGKSITVLMRIWVFVPDEHHEIREQAFELLKRINAKDRIWLHWGMCILAYPLFRDTATAIGRLLKLQDEFTLAQLQRRLIDSWGERSTVVRAFQRVVRSMVEWHTLEDADTPGHFRAPTKVTTKSKSLQIWFLRACHAATGKEMVEVDQLLSLPSSFPFKITVAKSDLRNSKDFSIHRQGLDMDMVTTTASNSKPKPVKKKTAKKKVNKSQRSLFDDDQSE
ncbi:hypothetical protein [Rubinisphaera brasiliensis]|uniref:Uncharacterized protein n=1 Tax=Rubinisphaera brasiliensis (strain ATCC 49424 / DSM 5305 / JCM 21570 / IAM 15109 / NBRC 103401 / IFAM 1448) TaxID=756272 RepID=F0SKT3_RUBBR|nr:hypothetical protein [Rubinisphaera brasiliensis]ADY58753.1 hypothetical protein Plabr_1137 [Rubinisphaera brasiliensis DSM 5305]